MGRLTKGRRDLLEQLAAGARIVHAPDGDCAWLSPRKDFAPYWNDLNWDDMAALRKAGLIADEDDGDDESRFHPAEVITPAGRAALNQQGGRDG
ncbi:hypothetical protein PMI01_00953 [Caulobacter sp. AP07]|uniref:hypothetical protein n=1 Tax=Caulobacter sp. AP07 TaxID=1144304 RepID=UPI0002721AD6|nr:hypothetical protein [Caulobacter sp. AP07]EJL36578.1 hypothetical protein PMI01_00953 [Caulobacter sp. AP07]